MDCSHTSVAASFPIIHNALWSTSGLKKGGRGSDVLMNHLTLESLH